MPVYMDLFLLINFGVDFLLLLGTGRLTGAPPGISRTAAAAGVGAIYAGACLLPEFRFLGGSFWRILILAVMAVLAFGFRRRTVYRGAVFVFLSMALGGVASVLGKGGFAGLVLSGLCIAGMCMLGFRGGAGKEEYVCVELTHGGKTVNLTALRDTGNTLVDPITGCSVLIVGADAAEELLALSPKQLADPVGTLASGKAPGLRLIPYRAVGSPSGLLLAAKLDRVIINGESAGRIVAFAPQLIGSKEKFQALTGGMV